MQESELKEFGSIMTALSVVFFKNLEGIEIDGYFEGLKDLSLTQVKCSVELIIKTRAESFFPTIGEIRAKIEGTLDEHARLAWGDCIGQGYIPINDYRNNIKFKDSLTKEVLQVAFGGVDTFYRKDATYSEMSDRKHFIETYKSLSNKQEIRRLLLASEEIKKLQQGE